MMVRSCHPRDRHPKYASCDQLDPGDDGKGHGITQIRNQQTGQQRAASMADIHDRPLHAHAGAKPLKF